MAKYATELREAVLRQVLSGDMTPTEASHHFDVSYRSAGFSYRRDDNDGKTQE